jgi:acetate kinase
MDTILVVNSGSSSVKFQIFAVEGEGGLRRQIKGQMDGIGGRPRLRASGSTGERWPTGCVCTENLIRVADVMESPKLVE